MLRHVFGGVVPAGLREQLLEPLLNDPRLQRTPGGWRLRVAQPDSPTNLRTLAITAVAIAATGPRPARHRVLGLAALHVEHGQVVGRFAATLNPGARVPGYVAERTRLGREVLDDLPNFDAIVDDLLAFLGQRPLVAQEAGTAWAFLDHEARRVGRTPAAPPLIDLHALADLVLDLPGKPTLPSLAQHLGVGLVHVGQPDDEARVVAEVAVCLLDAAARSGLRTLIELVGALESPAADRPLRQSRTARELPETPGVYRLRDAHDQVLYVGKARRLRQRLQDYVHRPLGATRRLEGLADAVSTIDTTECGSDLQALILEDREIRGLGPRYNTQRRLRAPRAWLRRDTRGISLCEAPDGSAAALGPFRNANAAQAARHLARQVFGAEPDTAWAFLVGDPAARRDAVDRVRGQIASAPTYTERRALEQLLAGVIAFDLDLLPADPRQARYAVVRPTPDRDSVEVFVLDAAILVAQARVPPADVSALLENATPLTEAADRDVVLRWLGSQRPAARIVHLAEDGLEALFAAVAELLAARDA